MAQIHPALGASARMTWKVVSFPLIAGLLLLKPVVDAVCAFVLVFGLPTMKDIGLTPLVTALVVIVLARALRYNRRGDFILVGLALGFGLFAALYHLVLMVLVRD